MKLLSREEIAGRISELPGWTVGDAGVHRTFTFPRFPDAITFVVRAGFLAEATDHHPMIVVEFRRVSLTFITHSAGGVTQKDFDGAAAAGRAAGAMGGR